MSSSISAALPRRIISICAGVEFRSEATRLLEANRRAGSDPKIAILGHEAKVIRHGVVPNLLVIRLIEPGKSHMARMRKQIA
jgi:hypothetical protein